MSQTFSYVYDGAGDWLGFGKSPGRRGIGGITRTLYDMDGRMVKVIRPREYERAGEKGYGEQYAYDLSGRLLSVTSR